MIGRVFLATVVVTTFLAISGAQAQSNGGCRPGAYLGSDGRCYLSQQPRNVAPAPPKPPGPAVPVRRPPCAPPLQWSAGRCI